MANTTFRYPKLAEEIRAQRARRRMSQDDLARMIGMHPNTFTRRVANPADFTVAELDDIAAALRIDLRFTLAGVPFLERTRRV